VPSAWAVQEDLILKVAHADGQEPDNPFAWYREGFGKPSTYDDLLDTLTHTPIERQALLRGFFEPTEEEREQNLKVPTAAHRAIARLAAAGLVRVILMTNLIVSWNLRCAKKGSSQLSLPDLLTSPV
jgi:hypothetical protein